MRRLVERALNDGYGVAYINLSNRNVFPDPRVSTLNLDVSLGVNAWRLLELVSGGGYDVMVLDNVPRMFFDVELPHRRRWGYVAAVLSMCLRRTWEGVRFIAINYRGKSVFGEKIFSHYFTHRVITRLDEGRVTVSMTYPLLQSFSITV